MLLLNKRRQHFGRTTSPPLFPILCLISTFAYLLSICSASSNFHEQQRPQPTVLLPSVFHWDSNNIVYVTPADTGSESVDITLRVQSENANGEKRDLYSETARSIKGTHAFKVPLHRLDSRPSTGRVQQHQITNFYVTVQVSGHLSFSTVLFAASDVRQIYLQTDKVFYRPEERVNIRALPLTSTGQLYKGPIQFQLLDPNGFRIFNKTNSANMRSSNEEVELDDAEGNNNGNGDQNGPEDTLKSTAGFLAEHFDLPKFLRFGDWRVVAFAVDDKETNACSSTKFQQTIRVREYVIPKFHVFMDIDEGMEGPLLVKINVLARFAHGMLVNGELTLRCAINNRENMTTADSDGIIAPEQRHRSYLLPSTPPKKLLSAQLTEGRWSGNMDLSQCVAPGQAATMAKILITAEVFERGTFQTGTAHREWEPFVAGFEMIPLQPAFTERTLKLHLFLRLLSTLNSIRNGRVELVSQCISEDRSVNGLNQSMVQRLGTLVDLDVDNKCLAYVIRARRKLTDGNFSAVQTLVMPSLRGIDSLDLSLIQMQPNRVDYVEGEVLEAHIPTSIVGPLNTFNYAFYCNNEVVVADQIAQNGRILVPITARMPTGQCVLYVYGPKWATTTNTAGQQRKHMVVDMRLFYVRTGECADERYGMHLSQQTNQTVGAPLNVTLRARPNSLAILHAYDSRLEALLRPSSALSPSNGQHWSFTEFLTPDPDEQRTLNTRFTWFSNLLNLAEVVAKRKLACQAAGKFAPQCPGEEMAGRISAQLQQRHHSMPIASSRLSQDCQREMMEECQRQKSIRDSAARFLVENMERRPLGNPPMAPQPPPPPPPQETAVKMASNVAWLLKAPQTTRIVQQTPAVSHSELQELKNAIQRGQMGTKQHEDVILRDFFPEVWLFNDFHIGPNGTRELMLRTPHSVTEWRFSSKFWTMGRVDVCQIASQSLFVQRDVFMDVDVPLYIYVNETVQVQVTVSAEHLNETGKRMAVCFRGLSPSVCGDVGRDGTLGETDFTRIELTPQNPVQLKRFFVRFLRPGKHNLTFELRAEEILRGHDWHCRDGNVQVFDRILKQIHVRNRVDLEEHFRQIVIYRRRRIDQQQREHVANDAVQPTLEQVLGENISSVSPASFWLMQSAPDVISYSVQQPMEVISDDIPRQNDGGEQQRKVRASSPTSVQTRVQINAAGRRVYMVGVEFSKFVASFPPALSTELLAVTSALASATGSSGLHRLRNRPALNSLVPVVDHRMTRSVVAQSSTRMRPTTGEKKRRKKKGKGKKKSAKKRMAQVQNDDADMEQRRPLQGYSLPNLLKELAQISYELKSLRVLLSSEDAAANNNANNNNNNDADDEATALLERLDRNWMRTRERTLGNLLAELLTFSDCNDGRQGGVKTAARHIACGFGEFGKPANAAERNLVLTTLATSLLCEQRASDEFVCGPIQFLAESVGNMLNESGNQRGDDWGLDSFVQFNNSVDRQLFIEALMVQVALDCSAYVCTASHSAKEAWKRLHASFYRSIDLNTRYDVRVVAALAYTSTVATRSIMRSKLASRTRDDDHVPFWAVTDPTISSGAHNLLERSLQRSSNVLVNALALLAYTQDQSIYRFWRNEFDLEALSNWLIEQQDHHRQYENALDTYFATRALHQFSMVNSQRQMRQALAGTINGNFTILQHRSPPVVLGSHQFRDGDLPFILAIPPTVDQMDLETKGDSRILLGVRVLMEKRKRSRRDDPSGADTESVTLRLEQKRIQSGYINQTVTIITHFRRLRTLHIEHGLFTGFSSMPNFVQILTTPMNFFQIEPRVSPTAIHFVMSNLSQETPAVYTVTLMEPSGGYSPTNLAPISINAMHHHLALGQLIVLPEEVDFVGDDEHMRTHQNGQHRRRRKRRSISPSGRQRFPSSASVGSEGAPPPPPAHFQVADSFLTQLDDDSTTMRQQQSIPQSPAASSTFFQMITERASQPQSEVVETVCLQNGACTCAELSCTVKCTTACDHLSFEELCETINAPDGQKFVLIFRTNPAPSSIRQVHVGTAEYTLLQDVRIVEWKSDVVTQEPEHLTIWIRNCNVNCLKMVNDQQRAGGGKSSPRFLLIGDPMGLFDESSGGIGTQSQDLEMDDDEEENGEEQAEDGNANGENDGEEELEKQQQSAGSRHGNNNNNNKGKKLRTMMQMHYLMRDNDRLLRSTDCYELFGKVSDESCNGDAEE